MLERGAKERVSFRSIEAAQSSQFPTQLTWMQGNDDDGKHQHQLDVHDFEGMDGGDGEDGRLLVLVVHLMEMLVQKGRVINAMNPIGRVVLVDEHDGHLQEQPPPAVFGPFVVEGEQGTTVHRITGHGGSYGAGKHQREAAEQDLMSFQVWWHELLRLALPFLRTVSLADVKEPLEKGV